MPSCGNQKTQQSFCQHLLCIGFVLIVPLLLQNIEGVLSWTFISRQCSCFVIQLNVFLEHVWLLRKFFWTYSKWGAAHICISPCSFGLYWDWMIGFMPMSLFYLMPISLNTSFLASGRRNFKAVIIAERLIDRKNAAGTSTCWRDRKQTTTFPRFYFRLNSLNVSYIT